MAAIRRGTNTPFRVAPELIPSAPAQPQSQYDLRTSREKARLDAHRLIETKSRALRPIGPLPPPLPLKVALSVKGILTRFTASGNLNLEPSLRHSMPLNEAVKLSRRTLLLGDLGTGKSTLAGLLVVSALDENEQTLAFIIPAKGFDAAGTVTVRGLLKNASDYFNEQISPAAAPVDLETLLKERVEILLVVDGLDEVSTVQASSLLSQLTAVVDHWPNIQILATGRPVELRGVNFEDWELLSTLPLDDAERRRLFEEEASADGRSVSETKEIATRLLQKLGSLSSVDSLATSPLIVRLLYTRLLALQEGATITLGDLLYELLKERLGGWSVRSGVQSAATNFETAFPDENSRSALFGKLALEFSAGDGLTTEGARLRLQSLVRPFADPNELVVADEALQFLSRSGLVSVGDKLEFPIQPLFEALCGYAIAVLWKDNDHSLSSTIDPDQWRAVSFAAAALRRLGLLSDLRNKLLEFIDRLLAEKQNAFAGAFIVSESQDKSCAERYVADLVELGRRPLTRSQKKDSQSAEDKVQSARAVAEALRLAGSTGFDWMFNEYLDPRYPFIETANDTIENIFEQWSYLAVDQLTSHESERLGSMVMPHLRGGSSLLYRVIPFLAILVPERFRLDEKLWFCGNFLGRGPFSDRGEQVLRTASGQRVLVNNVLVAHANRGYENAARAARLWLKLNPEERPPLPVMKALIRSGAGFLHDHPLTEALKYCEAKLGQDAWRALLRWCLSDKDEALVGCAAIELFNQGERRLNMLGEPLTKVLGHWYYIKEAEDALSQLIHDGGQHALDWLAEQIVTLGRAGRGAPAGCWRVLLSELPSAGEGAPNLLAKCSKGLGTLLLIRNSEIRQSLRDLMLGSKGTQFRSALRDEFNHLSPERRFSAAMILIVCDPAGEGQALEIVIKSTLQGSISWPEWGRFILSLSFGPSVLSYIESKLPTFDSTAETFALLILNRNGIRLSEERREQLARGIADWKYWALDLEDSELSVASDPQYFDLLARAVENGVGESAGNMAYKLLSYHPERLTPEQYIRCVMLTRVGKLDYLRAQIKRMQDDPAYADTVRRVAEEIVIQGGKKPLLDLVREALGDEERWEDVVWRMLCDGHGIYEEEGLWLLDYGRDTPSAAEIIGRAAQKFLRDPRVENLNHSHREAIQWLTLLYDEFTHAREEDLGAAILKGHGVHDSALVALIARLGGVPEGYDPGYRVGAVPPLLNSMITPRSFSEKLERLKELARPSGKYHPDICTILDDVVTESALSSQELNSLAAEGTTGALISSALLFAYDEAPKSELVIKLISATYPSDQMELPCVERLLWVWRVGQYKRVRESEETKAEYVERLNQALKTGANDVNAIATELLALRGFLTVPQIGHVIENYTKNLRVYDYGLGDQLIGWLLRGPDEGMVSELLTSIDRGIERLDQEAWGFTEGSPIDPFRFLFFPLAYWKLAVRPTEQSIRVFLRGLKFTFAEPGLYSKQRVTDPPGMPLNLLMETPFRTMRRIEPLLSKTPISLIDEAISKGQRSEDMAVRSICRLFGEKRKS